MFESHLRWETPQLKNRIPTGIAFQMPLHIDEGKPRQNLFKVANTKCGHLLG
jgi:hypothetical protein